MMTWLRRLLWLAIAGVAIVAVTVAVLTALGPRWLVNEASARAAEHGLELSIEGLAFRRSGSVTIDRVTLSNDAATIDCDTIAAQLLWRGLIARRTPLRTITVARCDIAIREPSTPEPSPTRAPDRDPGHASNALLALDSVLTPLGALTERLEISTIAAATPGLDARVRERLPAAAIVGHTGDAQIDTLVWTTEALSFSASLRVAGIPVSAELRYPQGGVLRVVVSPVSALGSTLRMGAIVVGRDGGVTIETPEIGLPFGAGVLRADRVAYVGTAAVPWIVTELRLPTQVAAWPAARPAAHVSTADGDAVGDAGEPPPGVDLATPWAAWVRAHERLTLGLDALEGLPRMPVPIQLEGLTLPDGVRLARVMLGAPLPDPVDGDATSGMVAVWQESNTVAVAVHAVPLSPWVPSLGAGARLSAFATIEATGVTARGHLHGVTIAHDAIANDPVVVPDTAWSFAWSSEDTPGTLTAQTTWGALASTWSIAPDPAGGFVARWSADAPWACEDAWRALPAALLPTLGHDAIRWSGTLTPSVRLRLDPEHVQGLELDIDGVFRACTVETIAPEWDPAPLLEEDWTYAPDPAFATPGIVLGPGAEGYRTLASLPAYIPAVMYLSEEVNFPTNPGFAEGLIERGMRLNLSRGRYVYGGSSISQQLVKNVFLRREKTLARKIEEAAITIALEAVVPKWRILELYVNCIEFGPDVWGIEAAARHYFGRDAAALTPLEAAFLANLKPAPREGNVHRRRGRSTPTGWWPERLGVLIARLVEHGRFITQKEADRYAPYVVALRTDTAALDDDGLPILGDGDIVRIPRPSTAVEVWSVPRVLSEGDTR